MGALRALLRATTEEEVVGILIGVVRDLGGTVTPPTGRVDQLPVDLTFGLGPPLVPTGDQTTLAFVAEVVPGLVADAHVALERVRRETHFVASAATDVLTGLPNRRTGMRVLARLRGGDTVAMVDLDHFKAVNDTHGHAAGDVVLRLFARAIRDTIRASDTAARLGGEEFVLLLPHTGLDETTAALERLRSHWATIRPHEVTFSAGVAAVQDEGREALNRADIALYRAKAAGRDRIEVES